MQTIEEELAHHPFFAGIDPRFVAVIAGCGSNVQFEQDVDIFRESEQADRFYVIRHGRLALETDAPHLGRLIIETIEAGEVLGWSWLFPPYRWHFDAKALTAIRATAFDGACLRSKCQEDPELGYDLMSRFAQVLMERLQWTRLRLLDVYGHSTAG
jgi:CRP/FNR family transcriptional regulator, cyclic AMP receptor protein